MPGLPKEIPYTKVPNFLLDNLMSELRGGEFKVALAICRKTFGFHKMVDGIPISQIVELTGLVKNSVLKAIRNLVRKNIIQKNDTTIPYRYSINVSNHINQKPQKQKTTHKPSGAKTAPQEVQKVNRSGVQKMNPQKKELKETEKNTTSSRVLSKEVLEVINYWNEVFPETLDASDSNLVGHIEKALEEFSVPKIKKAIFNRSNSKWYMEKKPFIIDKPSAFFLYSETIENDSKRKPDNIFTYEEKVDRICKHLNKDQDFEIMHEIKDKQGRPKWKLSDG